MKLSKIGAPLAILTASALALTGCGAANEPNAGAPAPANTAAGTAAPAGSGLSGTLTGKGASSMNAAQIAWIAEFQTANPDVTVNYSPDGSGSGRDAFKAGAADFAGSDRAFKDEEMGAGNFATCTDTSDALNLPVFISPIAVIYNVEGVEDLKLDAATIAGIFSGKITNWNAPEIAALNEGATLPDAAITAVHRSDNSGTTENFTDYLAQVAPEVWTEDASGDWPTAYVGEAAKGTSGVVDAVKSGTNTIGYADAGQAPDLDHVQIKVGDQHFGPEAEAAAKLVDNASKVDGRGEHDWALKLDRKAEDQYPIALVAYAMVCEEYKDSAQGALVKEYLSYVTSNEGQQAASAKAGNAPLSSEMEANVKAAIDSIK